VGAATVRLAATVRRPQTDQPCRREYQKLPLTCAVRSFFTAIKDDPELKEQVLGVFVPSRG
jgi:hypothetical protein